MVPDQSPKRGKLGLGVTEEMQRPVKAIDVVGLSKIYQRGDCRVAGYRTLRDSVAQVASNAMQRSKRLFSGNASRDGASRSQFHALRDVSFEVARGEAVGIIGSNGAGKSTLLKVISRITMPTAGRITLKGRISSLLEVGTGFHPELTGAENIFLNGAILGMSRVEIERRFDEIVEFAEVADFLHTPVKRYSSGMFVRLAFSVAAHLSPDILVIDEVLSVGDLRFQRKCLDFVKQLQSTDATILIVSHNMASIRMLCDRVIYMQKGQVAFDGDVSDGVTRYEQDHELAIAPWAEEKLAHQSQSHGFCVKRVELLNQQDEESHLYDMGERIRMRIHFTSKAPIDDAILSVGVCRTDGVSVCNYNTHTDRAPFAVCGGDGVIDLITPPIRLVSERYSIQLMLWSNGFQRLISAQQGPQFQVRHELFGTDFGVFHEPAEWRDLTHSPSPTGGSLTGAVP